MSRRPRENAQQQKKPPGFLVKVGAAVCLQKVLQTGVCLHGWRRWPSQRHDDSDWLPVVPQDL